MSHTPLTVPIRLDGVANPAGADRRFRMLAELDTRARVSIRPIHCTTCDRPLVPAAWEESCGCPTPTVISVDQLLDAYAAQLQAATDRASRLQAAADGATARAECAEAAARTLVEGVAQFIAAAQRALGTDRPPVVAPRPAAESLAEESR